MLTPDRLKPFLLHDDPAVRRSIVDYFSESWSDDPDLLPMTLDACERFGFAEDGRNLLDAARFAVTESTLDRLLGLLDRADDPDVIQRLNRIVANAPGAVLRGRVEAIDACANIRPEFRPRLRARQDYVDWSGERLWAELRAFAERSADQMYVGEINHDYADDLIDALGEHDVPDAAAICRAIEAIEEDDEDAGWLETFVVDLAGRRRLREAIPGLLAIFHFEEADYLTECATHALEQIGGVEAVRLIREAYPGASFGYRISAAFLLGRLPDPESESAVLELLEGEDDEELRTWLCMALCGLFSERGFDAVRRETARGSIAEVREFCEPALVLMKVLGLDPPPEAEVWEGERARQQESMARAMVDLESLGLVGGGHRDSLFDDDDYQDPGPEEYPGEVTAPIRNIGPKVGRNDPCPCGSGKKFKKCCGRSA